MVSTISAPECASTPSPADLSVDVDAETTGGEVTISWVPSPTGDPATSYNVWWGTTSGSLTDLGATSNTSVDITGVALGTQFYWSIVPSNSGGAASGCPEWTFTTAAATMYCAPGPTSVDGVGMTNVSFSTIVDNPNESSAPFYTDNSTMVGDVTAGASETINITFETGYTYNAFVWIDWNDDFDFDDGDEAQYLGEAPSTNPTTQTWTFLVPSTAAAGNHRLRIGVADNGLGSTTPSNPCYTGTFGEFVDYTVNVIVPSCINPSALTVSNVTTTEADLAWTAGGTESAWDLYIVASGGTAPDAASTPTMNDTGNPSTWSGGSPATAYDAYVRADCGGDLSDWVGPVSFTTACATFTAPYTEDFEDGGALDACWTQEATTDQLDWTPHSGSTTSSSTGPSSANGGTYYIYVETSSTSNSDAAVIYSPDIDLSGLTIPRLNFYYHMYGAGMDPDGSVDVAISTDGGSTYASVFNQAGNQGNQWNQGLVDLSSYSGVVSFRITGTISSTGTIYENDFAIDDFMVEETPSCPPPTALAVSNVTPTGADFGWTAGGSEGVWDLYIVPAGDPAPGASSTPTMNDTGNPSTWSGGAANTAYDAYVRADCAGDNTDVSTWVGPVTITTLVSCPSPTALAASNETLTGADFAWTAGGTESAWDLYIVASGGTAPNAASTPTMNDTGNPSTWSGGAANTTYDAYVRADCGGDNADVSTWVGPVSFTTACVAMAIPYSEDFELNADCWSFVDVNGDSKTWSRPTTDYCGSKVLRAGYSASGVQMDDWAVSPGLLMTSGSNYNIGFTSGNNSISYTEKMEAYIMDGPDPTTANMVMIYNDADISDNDCFPSNIQVTAPAGWTDFYVGFHAYSDGNQYYLVLDNFSVELTPAESTWTVDDNDANSCDLSSVNGAAGNVWHHLYNGSDLIASVNTNGQDLGSIFVEMRDAAAAVEEYSVQGSTDMKKTLPKFYNFDSDNTFANDVTIRLYFTDAELAAFNASALGSATATLSAGDIDITHYDGLLENCDFSDNDGSGTYSLIDNASITVGTVASGFYLEFDVSSFSEFLPHEPAAAPLPVTLTKFTGTAMTRSNLLTWSTETERNSAYFELQRSNTGSSVFESIGRVNASGNTNLIQEYGFEDKSPSSMSYYRLKMVDLDGSFEYSDVISLLRKQKGFGLYGAYPVPTNSVLTVEYTTEINSDMSIELSDITGRIVLREKFESTTGVQKYDVDMFTLESGTYFVKLSDGQHALMQRVVKQ